MQLASYSLCAVDLENTVLMILLSVHNQKHISTTMILFLLNSFSIVCPTGVILTQGKLIIRVYKGEDFPQLDAKKLIHSTTGEQGLVDPYCIVSYAGHKEKTSIIKKCYDPEWNYEICLPFQVLCCMLNW